MQWLKTSKCIKIAAYLLLYYALRTQSESKWSFISSYIVDDEAVIGCDFLCAFEEGSYFHAPLCLWLVFLQGGRSAVQHRQHAWSEEEENHSSGQRSGEKPTAKLRKII